MLIWTVTNINLVQVALEKDLSEVVNVEEAFELGNSGVQATETSLKCMTIAALKVICIEKLHCSESAPNKAKLIKKMVAIYKKDPRVLEEKQQFLRESSSFAHKVR